MKAASSAISRYCPLIAGVAGLGLMATGSPSASEQVMDNISAPPPLISNQDSNAHEARSNEDSAWPQIKRLIDTLENLSIPVEPDKMDSLLNLNNTEFVKSKKILDLGYSPDRHSRFLDIQYENVPDNNKKIYMSLSVPEQIDIINYKNIINQRILFSISPMDIKWPCIAFSDIENDLTQMNWDGRYPGFYRGVDGASIPDYDIIYLKGKNIYDFLVAIYLSKKTSCIIWLNGYVQNWKGRSNVK